MSADHHKGLVVLSADPITNGHLHLIDSARHCCRELLVLIANNDNKKGTYLFSLEERMAMAARATAHLPTVSVVCSRGLLVDVFLEQGCDVLYRGIRNESDQRYEEEQMSYHTMIHPSLADAVVYLPSAPDFRHISSTLVKAFASHHADISTMVPVFVKQAIEERMHKQFKLGITGEIATGKTWVCAQLAEQARAVGLPVHLINVDQLIRDLYREQTPGAQRLREELGRLLGPRILTANGCEIDRTAMASVLFDPQTPSQLRRQVEMHVRPHVQRLQRTALSNARGLILIEWAQLAEMHVSHWTNHNVLVVESSDRAQLAERRGIEVQQLARMAELQWSVERKVNQLQRHVDANGHGQILTFDNRVSVDAHDRIAQLLTTIRTTLFPTLEVL